MIRLGQVPRTRLEWTFKGEEKLINMNTYVSLTFLHHTVFLKRRDCFLKRSVFPCNVEVFSTSRAKRSPLSRTFSMLFIMTVRTYYHNVTRVSMKLKNSEDRHICLCLISDDKYYFSDDLQAIKGASSLSMNKRRKDNTIEILACH